VVAVVDTGITAHADIVGPAGVVAGGAGSNLISAGYDFITDCRLRGTTAAGGCAATTAAASTFVAPSPDASDTGDYIDATDTGTTGSVFFGWPTSPSSWHGTHVAGIIAAIGNNSIGVIGGAYGAKILPVRALGKGGGYSTDVSEAILWAAGVHPTITNPNPAKVINLSTGSTTSCLSHRQAAINAAVAAGAVVVVAAGNENQDVANSMSSNCSNVISVAAVARDGSRAVYSNFSSPASNTTNPTQVTLAAAGGDPSYPASFDPGILSTVDIGATTPAGSGYAYMYGTSMATPYVSAAVALMLSYNTALTPARVKQILTTPAALTPFPSFVSGLATWDCSANKNCGAGILNVQLALQNSTTTAPAAASSSGGGCSLMPFGADPDVSLLLAILAVAGYWLHRRIARGRSAA
jgi:serine protease